MEQVEQLRGGGDGRPRGSFHSFQLLWLLFVTANWQSQHPRAAPNVRLHSVNLEIVTHVCIQPLTLIHSNHTSCNCKFSFFWILYFIKLTKPLLISKLWFSFFFSVHHILFLHGFYLEADSLSSISTSPNTQKIERICAQKGYCIESS